MFRVCVSFFIVQATIVAATAAAPPIGPFVGCFGNGTSVDVLPGSYVSASGLDSDTVTGCQQLCVVQGANYSAYHNGTGCFCGNVLPSVTLSSSNDKCDVPCRGNNSQICGGVGYISVYSNANITVKKKPGVNLVVPKSVYAATGDQIVVTAYIRGSLSATFVWLVITDTFPNGTNVSSVEAQVRSNDSQSSLYVRVRTPAEMNFTVCCVADTLTRCALVSVFVRAPTAIVGLGVSVVGVHNSVVVKRDAAVYVAMDHFYRIVVNVAQGCPVTVHAVWDRPLYVESFASSSSQIQIGDSGCTVNTVDSVSFKFKSTGPFALKVTAHNSISSEWILTTIRVELPAELRLSRRPFSSVYLINDTVTFIGDFGLTTNASVQWSVDDEQAMQLLDEVVNGTEGRAVYKIHQAGTFTVRCVVSNTVSNQTDSKAILVQTVLSDLHVVFDGNIVDDQALAVPLGEVIEVEAVLLGSDPIYFWTLVDDLELLQGSDPCRRLRQLKRLGEERNLSVAFTSPELHLVVVCTINFATRTPLYAKVGFNVQVSIGKAKLVVSPSSTILQNASATFIVDLASGSSVVYNWTIVDPANTNVARMMSNSSSFRFHFTSKGDYTVSAIAFNDAGRSDLLQTVIHVQPILCLPPDLVAVTLPLVQKHLRSRSFRLEVSATPNCTLFRIRYQWTVYPKQAGVDCSAKVEASMHVKMGQVATVNPIITVPERFLQLGTYCFRFEAILGSATSAETFAVSVGESDLVAAINGGSFRLVGAMQQLELDGTSSYDPDVNRVSQPQGINSLSYVWSCRSGLSASENGTCKSIDEDELIEEGHNCFVDGEFTASVIVIEPNTLQAGRTYLFELQVMKGNRIATARQQVCIVAGDPPKSPIINCLSCQRHGTEEFIPSRRTELSAQCATVDNCAAQTFQWRLYNVTSETTPVPVFLNDQQNPTRSSNRNLVVVPNVLDSRTIYRFELTVTEKNRNGFGLSSLTLRPNSPPSGGSCDVSPRRGTTLSTQFTFTCSGWTDNDSPLEYRFATGRKENALRRDRTIIYNGFQSQYVAETLPLGDERNNYAIYVFVSIFDRFGGETEVEMSSGIVVEPLVDPSDTAAVEEVAVAALERVTSSYGDDPQKVTETCGSIMETVNLAAAANSTETADRSIRAGLRQTCIEKLDNQLVESTDDAVRIGPVLVKATGIPEEIVNKTVQKSVLRTVEKIIVAVSEQSDIEETEESVTQVLEVFSNLITAGIQDAAQDKDSSYARVDADDTTVVEELSENIVNQVQNIGRIVANNQLVGERPSVVESPEVTIIASKTEPGDVSSETSSLIYKDIGFQLSSGFATQLNNKTNSSEVLQSIYTFNSNPFYYSKTSERVNTRVVGMEFTTTNNEAIKIGDLPDDSQFIVSLPRSVDIGLNVTETTAVPTAYTFLQLNLSALLSDEALSIEVTLLHSYSIFNARETPLSQSDSEVVEVYFLQHEGPGESDVTAESHQFNLTLDMFSGASNVSHQNYTIFLLGSLVNMTTNQFIGLKSMHSQLGFNVSVRIFYTACLFWDEETQSYSTSGCQPTALSTFTSAVCRCNHLTSFAGGMFPAPNPIDFSLFLSLDIASNPIALVTLIVVYAVYVGAVVLARRADMRDKRFVKEVPLCGANGQFKYEISVQTGFWFGSGTTANVGIVLFSGNTASGKQHLYRPGAFRRNSLDIFQIGLDERLDPVDKIRIWHDNSGNSASWNLARVQVKDLESGSVSFFVINDWLSVDSDTGLLDMEVPLATDEDLKRFSNVFSSQTNRGFSEKHLWFSVVERPARSRFTRVQRVTCCLCLFISFVTASAMWYGIAPEDDKDDLDLGFVSLSYQQIGISVMATAVTFPLNLLWITMFRKASVKASKKEKEAANSNTSVKGPVRSIDTDTLDDSRQDDPVLLSYKQTPPDVYMVDDDKFVSRSPVVDGPTSAEDLASREGLVTLQSSEKELAEDMTDEVPPAFKKSRFGLPHFFVYVAYFGCLATCAGGSVVIMIYGQQFGRTKALRWVATMFLSFFESVFFFEPLKVLVIAAFLALLIKPKSTTEDDVVYYNVEVKQIEGVEISDVKVLTDDDRTAARIRRQKHKHMIEVLLEIILYFIFLWFVTIIAYADRDERAFYMTRTSKRVFDVEGSYNDIKTADDFFKWANSTLVDGLYWDRWYNGDPVRDLGFTKGDIGKLLGGARLRQIRVKNDSCDVAGALADQIKECYSQEKAGNEQGSFGVGWTDGTNISAPPWRWSSSSDLDGAPYWGKVDVYSGNGYVQDLKRTRYHARSVLATLSSNRWIDRQTRAVFVEFTLYNANVNLFQSVTFLIEFPATGGAVPSYQFLTIRLIRYVSTLDVVKMACEILFIFFIILHTYRFLKEARKTGIRTFIGFFWTWVDLCFLLLSYTSIVYGIYRIVAIKDLLSRYSSSRGEFINFYRTVLANMTMQYVLAFLGFLVTIKVLKLFRFNRRMTMLGLVLKAAAWEIVSIILFLVAVLWTFAQFGYLVLQQTPAFRSLSSALITMLSAVLGEFDFYRWIEADRILAPVLFVFLNIVVSFVLLSVFVAILNISVRSIRKALLEDSNDFEVLDYMLRRIRLWLGFKTEATEKCKQETTVDIGDSADMVVSPRSALGVQIMDLEPIPEYTEERLTPAPKSILDDVPSNTGLVHDDDEVESLLDSLSPKLDTILHLLDELLPNRSKQTPEQTSSSPQEEEVAKPPRLLFAHGLRKRSSQEDKPPWR